MEAFLKKCKISKPVLKAVQSLSYKEPTAVQSEYIPRILSGEEISAKAPTGTGKTATFAIPLIELLSKDPYSVFSIILTPTRELALQISDQFQAFGSQVAIRTFTVTGGVDIIRQSLQITEARPHFLIATPGRLLSLLEQSDISSLLSNLAYLVLDEYDYLLESQSEDLQRLLTLLHPSKTLKFSATLDEQVSVGARADLDERFVLVPTVVKDVYLWRILLKYQDCNVIVFTSACHDASVLSQLLEELGLETLALHSLMSQYEREKNLKAFRSAKAAVLIATDVASRGLDLPQVRVVINHNVPRSSKLYLHRVGRTARAGKSGLAISLVSQFEVGLVLHIEKKLETKLKQLLDESSSSQLEDEVLDSMNKLINAKALTIHVSFK
jgi:ATP-dependent RNA helicase DDX49/DBP8